MLVVFSPCPIPCIVKNVVYKYKLKLFFIVGLGHSSLENHYKVTHNVTHMARVTELIGCFSGERNGLILCGSLNTGIFNPCTTAFTTLIIDIGSLDLIYLGSTLLLSGHLLTRTLKIRFANL